MPPSPTALQTSLVGSYAQPDWLIDRERLRDRFPPRVRAQELWRVTREYLEQAQDDATVIAIRDQERAGLDIITDGEMRRESYSNRFATALDGVDIDNPGTALDRSGHPMPVPRVVGPIRAQASGAGARRGVPASAAPTGRSRSPCPARSRCPSRRRTTTTTSDEELVLGVRRPRSTRRSSDLFAAGADVVQLDEPYMQARPEQARRYGVKALDRALDGVTGHHRRAHLLRLRRDHPRAARRATRSCPSWLGAAAGRSRSRPRSRTSTCRCSTSCRARRSSSA